MSILPDSVATTSRINTERIPRAEEWAWDFDLRDFKTKSGRMYKVYDDEAIKIWIWKLFLTERYQWIIHSAIYGGEHHTLIGRGYTASYINSLAEQMTRDAIELNLGKYIKDIQPINGLTPLVYFKRGTLYITFYADTIYNKEVRFNLVYNSFSR